MLTVVQIIPKFHNIITKLLDLEMKKKKNHESWAARKRSLQMILKMKAVMI